MKLKEFGQTWSMYTCCALFVAALVEQLFMFMSEANSNEWISHKIGFFGWLILSSLVAMISIKR
jgi:hypothetical protein